MLLNLFRQPQEPLGTLRDPRGAQGRPQGNPGGTRGPGGGDGVDPRGLWGPQTDGGRVFAPPTVLNFEKSKFTRKNPQIFTNGHFPAPYNLIGKTVTLTFQARSVRTHFGGWLWAQMPICNYIRMPRRRAPPPFWKRFGVPWGEGAPTM